MACFETFVFVDLEATGLAGSYPRPRMLELAMIAVTKQQFEKLHRDLSEWRRKRQDGRVITDDDHDDVDLALPRVANKLILCFQPSGRVSYNVCDITGLDNFNLEDQKRFSKSSGEIVRRFLCHLKDPICLVAHNGLNFDIPLLKAELINVGIDLDDDDVSQKENGVTQGEASSDRLGSGENTESRTDSGLSLKKPSSLTFVDSFEAFRQIVRNQIEAVQTEIRASEEMGRLGHFDQVMESDNDGRGAAVGYREQYEGNQCPSATSSPVVERSHQKRVPVESPTHLDGHQDDLPGLDHLQGDETRDDNEVTPAKDDGDRQRQIEVPPAPKRRKRFLSKSDRPGGTSRARKRLDFGGSSGNAPPTSFSLLGLHEHFFLGTKPRQLHAAEADALALLRICALRQQDFLKFAESHSMPFSSVKPMW